MKNPRTLRWGFVSGRTLPALAALAAVAAAALYGVSERRAAETCLAQLKQIYSAIGLYEFDGGRLPSLAFYPEQPRQDPNGIREALKKFGADPRLFLCPGTPALVRDTGLSYVWNVSLNGRSLKDIRDPVWMLVEVNALDEQIPRPHWGRYHILYTDGRVVLSEAPPEDLNRLLVER